jgi:uncharacterized protein YjlB
MLVVRALKISQLTDGGMPPTYDSMHFSDVVVIPAGVGHKRIEGSLDFRVIGAYPGGRLLRGLPGERPRADRNIASVPLPDNDPIAGPGGPLKQI